MRFHTRKWVKPEDLNPNSTLFGGRLLAWIDEEIALYAIIQLESPRIVTKHMSEINFRSSAKQGDIVEIGIDVVKFGTTSLTLMCEVRNMMTKETIITIDQITMVSVSMEGKPQPHGLLFIAYIIFSILIKNIQNWSLKDLAIVNLASFIPFGTFYIEKKYLKNA